MEEVEEGDVLESSWRAVLEGWTVSTEKGRSPYTVRSSKLSADVNIGGPLKETVHPTKGKDTQPIEEGDLDSDDDDLPAFDMSNDTPVNEETKVIKGIKL